VKTVNRIIDKNVHPNVADSIPITEEINKGVKTVKIGIMGETFRSKYNILYKYKKIINPVRTDAKVNFIEESSIIRHLSNKTFQKVTKKI
jgi:hypothetical protein